MVRALKKSTGTYYAIKVITKSSLLLANQSDPHRVTLERRVMTKCNHPFIIGLDYAFQTIDLVMMAMELGRCKQRVLWCMWYIVSWSWMQSIEHVLYVYTKANNLFDPRI